MKETETLVSVTREVVRAHLGLTLSLMAVIVGAVGFALLPPLVLERIVDALTAGQPAALSAVLAYFGAVAMAGLLEAAQNSAITVFGQKITHGLRSRMCAKLSRLPAAYFSRNEGGKITSRFVSDVDTVDALFTNGIIGMFADAGKIVGILLVIFFKSTGLGLVMLVVTPLLFWMTRAFQKRMLRAQLANRAAVGKVNNHVPETIRNLRMIRALFRQQYMERRYDDYISESYQAVERANLYDSIYSPIVISISSGIIALVMVLSAMGGGMRAFFGMGVGSAVAVIAYVGKVFAPLESIGMEIQNIQSAVAGVRRIQEFLEEEERSAPDPAVTWETLRASGGDALQFETVGFGYEPGERVLDGLTFTVPTGETATLVGRTGAGKSTAFSLLLGLYAPDTGHVRVFGAEAAAIPDGEKRRLFGYVEQTFHLVSGTVAEQISLFDPAIGREQVEWAAGLVGMHKSILALEAGYDTPAREELFSQGQLQLLSIARAVAANPAILLLDEITANLDSDTERAVLTALERASARRTVLSISHRLYQQTAAGRRISIGSGDTK